ncbi:hypothetical protein RQP46_003745 [Phenoliferia psychrophenolica]
MEWINTFHICSPTTAWYLDLTGSGNETISHLTENGRITILFQAFEGPPRIMRLFGTGKVFEKDSPEFNALLKPADVLPGTRSIIWIDIHKVGTSCGFSIPFFDFKEERPTLLNWAEKREKADAEGNLELGLKHYWATSNAKSMDGLPGLRVAGAKRAAVRPTLEGFWGGVGVGVVLAVAAGFLMKEDGMVRIRDILGIGIGLSIALRLAKDGYDISINDVSANQAGIDSAVAQIIALGRKAVGVAGDVSDEAQVDALVAATVEALGSLDCMVANAGICQVKPLLETTAADRKLLVDVNVHGLMNCFVSAARQMVKQGNGGRIIGA